MDAKLKYETVQEYLELYLYPSLNLAVQGLIEEIRKDEIYSELEKEFNKYFFENANKIKQKEKDLIKLERGSDYSESDYEYMMMKKNMNENDESNASNETEKEDKSEEIDPDLDDSMLQIAEQDSSELEEEVSEQKFNPIDYIAGFLKNNNLLKNKNQDFDEVYTGHNYKDEL